MTATPKLRAAIIGCGGIGKNHIRAYLHSGRYQVVALADLSQAAMDEVDAAFAGFDDYDATHYADATRMLDTEEIDVVSVATWHKGHAPWTIAAATRGVKAVLCEKPMAEDLGRAEEMLTVCARNDVKLVIAHQRRFLPSYNMARELIADGAIGDVNLIRIYGRDGLLNWSSHQFDMARYILGDDECTWVMGAVERQSDRWERSTRIEDKTVATFGFASGANAIVLSDTQPEYDQGGMVFGTDGMIDLHTEHLRLLNADTGGKWEHRAPNGRFFTTDIDTEGFSFEYAEGAAAQADELADWSRGRSRPTGARPPTATRPSRWPWPSTSRHGFTRSSRCRCRRG